MGVLLYILGYEESIAVPVVTVLESLSSIPAVSQSRPFGEISGFS